MIKFIILYIALGFLGVFYMLKLKGLLDLKDFLNILVLTLTLIAIVWTTLETGNNSIEDRHIQIKPIILREGILGNWDDIRKDYNLKKRFLFTVDKNHATNIEGTITYNYMKYPLMFVLGTKMGTSPVEFKYDTTNIGIIKMGWAAPGAGLIAYPDWNKGIKTNETNRIEIKYGDIGSTLYCAIEDETFSTSINSCN